MARASILYFEGEELVVPKVLVEIKQFKAALDDLTTPQLYSTYRAWHSLQESVNIKTISQVFNDHV